MWERYLWLGRIKSNVQSYREDELYFPVAPYVVRLQDIPTKKHPSRDSVPDTCMMQCRFRLSVDTWLKPPVFLVALTVPYMKKRYPRFSAQIPEYKTTFEVYLG